jgi:methionine synthase I (cobalamin-dependent)
MERDRAKVAARKGNECSSSHSKSSFVVGDMMSTVKKLSTAFAKTQLWELWNKLKERSTVNMDEKELQNHRVDLRLIEKYINFDQANEVEVEHEDEKE